MRQVFGFDPFAGVAHCDLDVGRFARDPHWALPGSGSEFDRVREQVPDRLLQSIGVSGDDAYGRIELRVNRDLLGVGGRARGVEGALDDYPRLDGPEIESH